MENLNLEFESAIKCHWDSFSSCQVFLPPAVCQHEPNMFVVALYLAPQSPAITSCPAALD